VIKVLKKVLLAAYVFFFATLPAYAAGAGAGVGKIDISGGAIGSVTSKQMVAVFTKLGEGIAAIAGGLAVIMLIYFGIRMVTALEEQARADAVKGIQRVIIGLAVVGLALILVEFVAWAITSAQGVA